METIQVRIGGQEYTLRCEDSDRTRKLAERFDTMMRQMKQRKGQGSTLVVTVVAALNLLEEYDLRCEELEARIKEYSEQIVQMNQFLTQSLAELSDHQRNE